MRPDLAAAYAAARYELSLPAVLLVLRIGLRVPAQERALLRAGRRGHCSLLSPCNPGSRRLPAAVNRQRLLQLQRCLLARQWRFHPALHRADDGSWPEPGFAIFDAPPASLRALAHRFRQLAWVCYRRGRAPQLVWSRAAR